MWAFLYNKKMDNIYLKTKLYIDSIKRPNAISVKKTLLLLKKNFNSNEILSSQLTANATIMEMLLTYYFLSIRNERKKYVQKYYDVIVTFIEHGVDLNYFSGKSKKSTKCDLLLEYVLREKNFELANLFLKHGANINAINGYKESLLESFIDYRANNNLDVIEWLLKNNADGNILSKKGFSLPMLLVSNYSNYCNVKEGLEILKNNGVDLTISAKDGTDLITEVLKRERFSGADKFSKECTDYCFENFGDKLLEKREFDFIYKPDRKFKKITNIDLLTILNFSNERVMELEMKYLSAVKVSNKITTKIKI